MSTASLKDKVNLITTDLTKVIIIIAFHAKQEMRVKDSPNRPMDGRLSWPPEKET